MPVADEKNKSPIAWFYEPACGGGRDGESGSGGGDNEGGSDMER